MIRALRSALPRRQPRTPPPPRDWNNPQGHTIGELLRMREEWAAEDAELARGEVAPPLDEIAEAS